MRSMIVAVIDVGSNTVRLLVARPGPTGLVCVEQAGTRLGLGQEIERRGHIPETKIGAAAKSVRKLSALARKRGASTLDVVVTAPGRQSGNGHELVAALERAAGGPVRVLSSDEEGRLAYRGAIAGAGPLPATIAVCDVGGASTEIAIGRPDADPSWLRSVELGAVRLTERKLSLEEARRTVREAFTGVLPPLPRAALAAGGSARALRKLVGPTLGAVELAAAEQILRSSAPEDVARRYRIDRSRAEILLAGVLVHAEVQRRLAVPLTVARGGLREGLALEQLESLAA
jgi:exopolyphosphatase/guanosine-5'-triphosphate,3'-diphosphate pyrophosphatase